VGWSSPDNDGTVRHCQTDWARQARREGVGDEPVVEPPQAMNQLQPGVYGLGSSARRSLMDKSDDSSVVLRNDQEATKNACGVLVARLQGNSWTPPPSIGMW
jgi:hypothetical protein